MFISLLADHPTKPKIYGFDRDKSLFANDKNLTLECRTSGGNPAPYLSFNCSNGVEGTEQKTLNGTTILSGVVILLIPKANAVECGCSVTQSTDYNEHEKVTLNILCMYILSFILKKGIQPLTPFKYDFPCRTNMGSYNGHKNFLR